MNKENLFISKPVFNELCKYICCQIQLSGSEQVDRETLNFAIYWQICFILDEQLELIPGISSKNLYYQQLLQNKIDNLVSESFSVSEIIDRNISELFEKNYSNSKDLNSFRQQNSEGWVESFEFAK